jgi:hypothetical protein
MAAILAPPPVTVPPEVIPPINDLNYEIVEEINRDAWMVLPYYSFKNTKIVGQRIQKITIWSVHFVTLLAFSCLFAGFLSPDVL